MPTQLPDRHKNELTLPTAPLLVPACLVVLSALLDADGFSPQALADVLLRASEALAQGELGLLRFEPR
jgi:hypothetical protein